MINNETNIEAISIEDAYKAMYEFITRHYNRTSQNEFIGDLLSAMGMTTDHYKTRDPAMWGDWIQSIEHIKNTKKTPQTKKGQNNV